MHLATFQDIKFQSSENLHRNHIIQAVLPASFTSAKNNAAVITTWFKAIDRVLMTNFVSHFS